MNEPWPYDQPIFRRGHRATSPDGQIIAAIDSACEVSMSNPTIGMLTLSTGLRLDRCNPSFVWSHDSRYLAVPRYYMRLAMIRRQRMVVLDVVERRVWASSEIAAYYQPESFSAGVLVATKNPFGSAKQVQWNVPKDLEKFQSVPAAWPEAVQQGVAPDDRSPAAPARR